MTVSVTFWGVRGSIPCCSTEYTEYGGNTACVQIDLDGTAFVLDVGSGSRTLGELLTRQKTKDISLLISHMHWDHICGFPFFLPIFDKDTGIRVYAPFQPDGSSAQRILTRLMSSPFFPLPLKSVPCTLHFENFHPSANFDLPEKGVRIETFPLTHPNGASGYRLNYNGKSVSYVSDYEHGEKGPAEELSGFVKDSDLMIYDAMYTPEEYSRFAGWGHSTWEQAARLTEAANVKQTFLFHHAPTHTDDFMREVDRQAKAFDARLSVAKENTTVVL